MRRISTVTVTLTAAATALSLAACGSSTSKASNSTSTSASSSSSAPAITATINVSAASSLQDTFTTLGKQFEALHPGAKVVLNFGASSTLAQQINASPATADVFASASATNMQQVLTAGNATTSTNFVSNVMEIAVPPSNPANVQSLADLAKSSVKVALCQTQVPCGAVAAQVFTKAGLTVKPVTLEADVKSTLSKVQLNEVDAGIVYLTDVQAAGAKVKGILIDPSVNASTAYPIAALSHASNVTGAAAFVAYVLSDAGQNVLAAAGFAKP